ncbi:MAG TPA: metallophosphoesterase [Chthonomonadaceae bacterium]|nr:metallophosphoesterase [Chthonomonadaceae bacterium]
MTHSSVQPKTSAGAVREITASEGRISRRQFILRNLTLLASVTVMEGLNEAALIEVTRHTVPLRRLQEPVRVVQITDLHRSWCVSEDFISSVISRTNVLQPDLVLLTGDFVTVSSKYAPSCMQQIERIQATLGKYAVLGNHDYWCDHHKGGATIADGLQSVGVEVVINRSTKLANGLRLVGLDDVLSGRPNLDAGFAQVEGGEPVLAMTHNPNLFYRLAKYDCVTLAGHTHGGQINVPFLSDTLMASPFTRGWYSFPDAPGKLYVSRGLGTIHVPIRLRSRPEIAVFDLIPA